MKALLLLSVVCQFDMNRPQVFDMLGGETPTASKFDMLEASSPEQVKIEVFRPKKIVYAYLAPKTMRCPACEKWKADIKRYEFEDFEFEVRPAHAEVTTYPSFQWLLPDGKTWWLYPGWPGPQEFADEWGKTQNAPEEAPTPIAEVRRVLALLHPQPNEVFVDYGCGDGRWLIEAAKTYGCRAVGIEIDPLQVDKAKQAVDAAGLVGRVQIIEGDALTTNVEAQVGVAYLYPDLLTKLKPKLLKLNRFATPFHQVEGVKMQQNGDAWLWQRSALAPVKQTQVQPQRPYAVYDGQVYYGRVCNNPRCAMCNAIQRQLGM